MIALENGFETALDAVSNVGPEEPEPSALYYTLTPRTTPLNVVPSTNSILTPAGPIRTYYHLLLITVDLRTREPLSTPCQTIS